MADETMQGKVSQAWIFRCCACPYSRTMESTKGRVPMGWAVSWAREEHWAKTKNGWKCPTCAKRGNRA